MYRDCKVYKELNQAPLYYHMNGCVGTRILCIDALIKNTRFGLYKIKKIKQATKLNNRPYFCMLVKTRNEILTKINNNTKRYILENYAYKLNYMQL